MNEQLQGATTQTASAQPLFNPLSPDFIRDPYPSYDKLRTHAPVLHLPALNGYLVSRNADAALVLRDKRFGKDYVTRITRRFGPEALNEPVYRAMGRWMLTQDPPDHTRLRRLLNRGFTSRAVNAMAPRIAEIVHETIDAVVGRRAIDFIRDLAYRIPAAVIMEMLGASRGEIEAFKLWSDDLGLFIGSSRVTADKYERAETAMTNLTGAFRELVAERRRRPRTDMISDLIRAEDAGEVLGEQELIATCVLLLFAGHETTGIALAWANYWLHRHPGALDRLRAEVDALGDSPDPEVIARLPYLDAVCNETLRLHPIVPDVPRMLTRPLELGGYRVAPPLGVDVATALVHRREALYPEPDLFRPERFLERRFTPFEFFPFGGGHRRCIGAAFATYELKIVLATFLRHAHLELAEPDAVKPARRNVVIGPATGVRMRLRERRSQRAAA